jgi:hypothetical protein
LAPTGPNPAHRKDVSPITRFVYVRAFGAAMSVTVMALTAGCGLGASPDYSQTHSAQQIVLDASKSTGSATSFHITIDATTKDGKGNADVDVEGSNVSGKIVGQGIGVRIIHVDGQTFVYGSDLAAILEVSNAQAAATVKAKASDKWVLMPADFWSSTGIDEITQMQKIADCIKTEQGLTKKGTSIISGQQVVEVDDQLASSIYVATAAPHYLVRLALTGVDTCVTDASVAQETIDLSKVGQKLNIAVPTGYVDLKTLAGG